MGSTMSRRRLLRMTMLAAGAAAAGGGLGVAAAAGPAGALPADFDRVQFWNDVLLRAFRRTTTGGGAPTVLARAAALLNTAMYDAGVSLGRGTVPYLARVPKIPNFSYDLDANVTAAAYRVLRSVLPDVDFSADYAAATSFPVIGEPGPEGWSVSVGDGAARQILDARANDGSAAAPSYQVSETPGQWRPTGSGPAVTPQWGEVRPFAMTSRTQFRPPLPGGFSAARDLLASNLYAAQLTEVSRLGVATGSTRTTDQTTAAFFWANDLPGTYKPPGQLLEHTKIIARQQGIGGHPLARLYALVSLAMADAAIVAWDAKYNTAIDLWRPETAIARADEDGRPETAPDRGWQPLSRDRGGRSFSPPFPAYVSGHAAFAGAWAGVLKGYFGTDAMTFTATTDDPSAVGVTRRFTSFSAAAAENARSRIYLGVHFQMDADAGLAAGTALGAWVAANALR